MKNILAIVIVIINIMTSGNAANVFSDNVLPPEVVNIELQSFATDENRAVLNVSLYNPNDFKLPVKEVYGDIYLNEKVIANIEALSKKSLGAHETQLFTVPVIVKPEQLVNASTIIMMTGVAHYRFAGHMMTPVGEIPVEHKDQLTKQQVVDFIEMVLAINQSR